MKKSVSHIDNAQKFNKLALIISFIMVICIALNIYIAFKQDDILIILNLLSSVFLGILSSVIWINYYNKAQEYQQDAYDFQGKRIKIESEIIPQIRILKERIKIFELKEYKYDFFCEIQKMYNCIEIYKVVSEKSEIFLLKEKILLELSNKKINVLKINKYLSMIEEELERYKQYYVNSNKEYYNSIGMEE